MECLPSKLQFVDNLRAAAEFSYNPRQVQELHNKSSPSQANIRQHPSQQLPHHENYAYKQNPKNKHFKTMS